MLAAYAVADDGGMDATAREVRLLRQTVVTIVVLAVIAAAFVVFAVPAIDRTNHDRACMEALAAAVVRDGCP